VGFQPLFGADGTTKDGEKPSFEPMFGRRKTDRPGFRTLAAAASDALEAPPPTAEELLDAARAEGAEQARAEAEAELAAMRAKLDTLGPALDQLAALRTTALREAASQIGDIVLQLTRRIVGDSLAANPEALPSLVSSSLSQLPDEDDVTIRVAPDDVNAVRDALDDRFEDSVLGDASITAGCRIETRHASIDATLEAALEAVGAAVRTWVETRG
jgi:flagellar biosynthesis/type III secretory pathway protein FliH